MFASALLKSALVCLTMLDRLVEADASAADIAAFPEWDAALAHGNADFNWESVPVTTSTGYQILMFRITPKVAPAVSKGPLLLLHGMYSEPLDFFTQTDPLTNASPFQLAADGYDVWVGCTRGREITLGHTTLDLTDPLQDQQYHDYSFHEVGKEDLTAFVDTIIAARPGTCEKVQIITHSTGANAALVAASDPVINWAEKVASIVTVGPCLFQDLNNFWLPVKDIPSVIAFYFLLKSSGITNLYGLGTDPNLENFCNPLISGDTAAAICNFYIRPNYANPMLNRTSLKDFQHAS